MCYALCPEFLNLLDEICLFNWLDRSAMAGVVTIQLVRLRALLENRHIELTSDQAALQWLVGAGYDPVYGAGR